MSATWDQSKFDDALRRYAEVSSRDMVKILNTKAYYIARKSLWYTDKADSKEIRALRTMPTSKRERAPKDGGRLFPAIINKRRGSGNGLYGLRMKAQVDYYLQGRLKTVAFLKSGWLPAIRGLDALAESKSSAGPIDRSAKEMGRPNGSVRVASESQQVATIINSALAKHDTKGALQKYGSAALQRAFDEEANSMEEYILKKQKAAAEQFNKG